MSKYFRHTVDLEKERSKMNFGFLLFDDLEELDLVGPWEIISIFNA